MRLAKARTGLSAPTQAIAQLLSTILSTNVDANASVHAVDQRIFKED